MRFKKGETLVEVVIAVSIISIVLISLLQLVYLNFVSGATANRKAWASYLAQDAAEIITNIRDTNSYHMEMGSALITRWNQNIYGCDTVTSPTCNENGYYSIDAYNDKEGWKLKRMVLNNNLPCYECPNAPIWPNVANSYTADLYLADGRSGMVGKPGYRELKDETATLREWDDVFGEWYEYSTRVSRGVYYKGIYYSRYIYIEKYNNDPNQLRARIIVSWKENNSKMSVGQDILLTNTFASGYSL